MTKFIVFVLLFVACALYAAWRYNWWIHIRRHPVGAVLLFAAALQVSWIGATKPDPPDPPKPEPEIITINLWLDDQDRFILIESPLTEVQP